ncbi:MAG: serine/threonine-protein kinase [Fodinibius sp.]|nr:serine/threonine-protein kinase [Fodinibius sp.]
MDKREWEKVERIVDEALEYPPENRLGYIKEKCDGDPELLEQAKQLLDAIDESESRGYLENTQNQKTILIEDLLHDPNTASLSLIGQSLGKYTITELLGHGGMSSVYLAERNDGEFDQQVALKILRRGMDTPKNLSRFQLEQTILADLKHPNIAQLYDGGVTDDGLPYLVMEYADGTPVTTYCDNHQLSIEERLGLFKDVCRAVQHAHANLVIHRDLKPDNILVTGEGNVKILDFGISKLIQQDANTPTTQTQEAQQMLTPAYAPPEQFTYDSITTAIDNYALGALLHKLLTGYPIFDLEEKSRTEISQLISRKMPQAPSQKLQELEKQELQKIAGKRSTDPDTLLGILRGDLDAIVLKAIRKEQKERYDSANNLIEDLNRYRDGQPVDARIRYLQLLLFQICTAQSVAYCSRFSPHFVNHKFWNFLYLPDIPRTQQSTAASTKSRSSYNFFNGSN